MDEKDIDEIITHIEKLRNLNNNLSKNSTKMDDVKENNLTDNIDTENEEPISIMKPEVVGWTDESKVKCDVCENEIVLGKNLSGLVIANEFFACETCCQNLSREELMEWTQSKMVSPGDVRPIGLWVIEQQRQSQIKEND